MTGEWLAYCGSCSMPEIANVLGRLDMPLLQVTEIMRGDAEFWREVEEWI